MPAIHHHPRLIKPDKPNTTNTLPINSRQLVDPRLHALNLIEPEQIHGSMRPPDAR
jgi:hypothetical protein